MNDGNLIINIFNQMQWQFSRFPIFIKETPDYTPSDLENDFNSWMSRQEGDILTDLQEFISKRKTNI
jgi:hypothetical protein